VGDTKNKITLEKHRKRWEYCIEISPKIRWGGVNWIDLTQDRD
jgi:hypothetical protein